MISIIVPIYNAEKQLTRCIESVICQSFQDWELILVDDGSRDASAGICDSFAAKDGRIKAFHIENGGVGNARNTGLEKASAEWVCFLDADDWIEMDYLASFLVPEYGQYDMILQGLVNEKDAVECGRKRLDGKSYDRESMAECFRNNSLAEFCACFCKLFKASLINKSGLRFPTGYQHGEDSVFVLRYLRHCRSVKCLDVEKYHYCSSSVTSLSRRTHDSVALLESVRDNCSELHSLLEGESGKDLLRENDRRNVYYLQQAVRNMYILGYERGKKLGTLSLIRKEIRPLFRRQELPFTQRAFLFMTAFTPGIQLVLFDMMALCGIIRK